MSKRIKNISLGSTFSQKQRFEHDFSNLCKECVWIFLDLKSKGCKKLLAQIDF